MIHGSLLHCALDRVRTSVLVVITAALLAALLVLAFSTQNGTRMMDATVEDGVLVSPFRWTPIESAVG